MAGNGPLERAGFGKEINKDSGEPLSQGQGAPTAGLGGPCPHTEPDWQRAQQVAEAWPGGGGAALQAIKGDGERQQAEHPSEQEALKKVQTSD